VSYISKSVELSQPRLLQKAIRQHGFVRKTAGAALLRAAVDKYIPAGFANRDRVLEAISLLPAAAPAAAPAATPAADAMEISDGPAAAAVLAAAPAHRAPTELLPEVEVFLLTLVLTTLLRNNCNEDAAQFSSMLVGRVRSLNRRSLDTLSSKVFFYFSLAYERIDKMENIRSTLLALYRTACLHHDNIGQAVLLNLLLRNYLHYNLVEQAQALAAKTTFPESASNNQFCRYLYSMGRLQTVQLEYSDAYMRLMMSARKAPQDVADGFSRSVHKLIVLVQLLMGDIPERSLFNQPTLRAALKPYLGLTQAVRDGDVQEFERFVAANAAVFRADNNFTLVQRLGHNVLKTGLRKISLSYSRISLSDIAEKLHLVSAKSAEYICAKAIRDGVIEASIDHENSCLISNEVSDLYGTQEPMRAFHRRIVFCLDVHNDSVKSMAYPPAIVAGDSESAKAADGDDKKGKKKGDEEDKTIDEIIKEIEDEMDEME
jgi:26S proteasome regulatory subunit N3